MLRNKNSPKYSELHPKRKLYSQNFLKDKSLVYHLVANSNINKNDVVIEIGPGKGIITKFLLQKAKEVIAIELDDELIEKLKEKFKDANNLKLVKRDIREFILPDYKYKVFSNIPFSITSDILHKFLNYDRGPFEAYIIVQLEVAKRFAGNPFAKESLVSLKNKPFFEFDVFYEFLPSDFDPAPNVKPVMVKIIKRDKPMIDEGDKELFEDFLAFAFLNQKARITNSLGKIFTYKQFSIMSKNLGFNIKASVSDLTIEQWIGLFNAFLTKVPKEKQILVSSYSKLSRH